MDGIENNLQSLHRLRFITTSTDYASKQIKMLLHQRFHSRSLVNVIWLS